LKLVSGKSFYSILQLILSRKKRHCSTAAEAKALNRRQSTPIWTKKAEDGNSYVGKSTTLPGTHKPASSPGCSTGRSPGACPTVKLSRTPKAIPYLNTMYGRGWSSTTSPLSHSRYRQRRGWPFMARPTVTLTARQSLHLSQWRDPLRMLVFQYQLADVNEGDRWPGCGSPAATRRISPRRSSCANGKKIATLSITSPAKRAISSSSTRRPFTARCPGR